MEIDITKISKVEGIRESFEIIDDFNGHVIEFCGDAYKICPPIKVNGNAINLDNKIQVELNITAKVEMTCSRCLEGYIQNISASADYSFVRQNAANEEECYLYKGDSIDITDLVMGEIAAELPMKPLCVEHCKGLCPKCGANKNTTDCACKNEEIDSRLQILSKLLDEEQGGV